MKTVNELNQALQSLQLQTKKNTEEMHVREELRKHAEKENYTLTNEIKSEEEEIRIEDQKVLKMKQAVLAKQRKIQENKEIINRAIQEFTKFRLEIAKEQSQLSTTEREYREAVATAARAANNANNNGMKHY